MIEIESPDEFGGIPIITYVDGKAPHRRVLEPGTDIAGEPPEVSAAATEAWTPAVLAARERMLQERYAALAESFPEPTPEQVKTIKLDIVPEVAMQVAFNHENRIRALEGKAPILFSSFRTAVKKLLDPA